MTTNVATDFFQGILDSELPLIEGPILQDLTTLTGPNVTFITALDTLKNLQLQGMQLNLPAQTALLNFTAGFIIAKFNAAIAARKVAIAAPAA